MKQTNLWLQAAPGHLTDGNMPAIAEMYRKPPPALCDVLDRTRVIEIRANDPWTDDAMRRVRETWNSAYHSRAVRIPSVGAKTPRKVACIQHAIDAFCATDAILESLGSKGETDEDGNPIPKKDNDPDPDARAASACDLLDDLRLDRAAVEVWIGGTDASQDQGKLGAIYDPFADWQKMIGVIESRGYMVGGIIQALPVKRVADIDPYVELSRSVNRTNKRPLVWIPTADDGLEFSAQTVQLTADLCEALGPRFCQMVGVGCWKRPVGIPTLSAWVEHCVAMMRAVG